MLSKTQRALQDNKESQDSTSKLIINLIFCNDFNLKYRGTLRKLQANYIHNIKRVNFDRFHEEQYLVR